eukprot:scaffold1590_cov239-Pinguiococcus_pyrenoidosus.AAC.10
MRFLATKELVQTCHSRLGRPDVRAVRLTEATRTGHAGHLVELPCFIFLGNGLGNLRDERLRREHQACHRRAVLEGRDAHAGAVNDPRLQEVLEDSGRGVPAEPEGLASHPLHDDVPILAGVERDLLHGLAERLQHDLGADLLVLRGAVLDDLVPHVALQVEHGGTAAGEHAHLHGALDGVQGILVPQLLILELGLRRSADLDARDASAQGRDALLGLLLIELRVRLLGLHPDRLDALVDRLLLRAVHDDRGLLLVADDALCHAEVVDGHAVEGDAHFLGNVGRAGGDRDVLEVRLAAIAEAGGLDRADVQDAAHLVHDEGREGLARHVLGHDEQRLLGLHHALEQREELVHGRDLAVGDEDARALLLGDLALLVLDKVGAHVATVDGKALGELDVVRQRLALLHHGGAGVADLLEALGNDLAHGAVAARRDGGDVHEVIVAGDGLRQAAGLVRQQAGGLHDAAAQANRVGAGRNELDAVLHKRLRHERRGGGAVAGVVVRLGGHFLHEAGADVHLRIGELDVAGDGHAVVDDLRRAVVALQDHVATLGAQGDLDRVGHAVDALHELGARVLPEAHFLRHHAHLQIRRRVSGARPRSRNRRRSALRTAVAAW